MGTQKMVNLLSLSSGIRELCTVYHGWYSGAYYYTVDIGGPYIWVYETQVVFDYMVSGGHREGHPVDRNHAGHHPLPQYIKNNQMYNQ